MYPTAETEVHIEIRRRTGTLQYRNSIHLDLVLKIHPASLARLVCYRYQLPTSTSRITRSAQLVIFLGGNHFGWIGVEDERGTACLETQKIGAR
jgi:hypothetical protein